MTIVEINEGTKEGKAILEVLDLLSKGNGIRILKKTEAEKEGSFVSENVPNDETLKVFRENDKRETSGLKKYDSVEELFEDLGI